MPLIGKAKYTQITQTAQKVTSVSVASYATGIRLPVAEIFWGLKAVINHC
jgi:hypothetical protein